MNQHYSCYILAFKADDAIHAMRQDGTRREAANWRTLLPFWEYVEYHSRRFAPLQGICLQLGAIIREVIQGLAPADTDNTTRMRRLWLEGTAKLMTDDVLQQTFPKTWDKRVKNPLELTTNNSSSKGFYLPMSSCITTPHEAVYATISMLNEWAKTELKGVNWDDNRLGF